ncbi:hypothetical protein CASFOL_021576 [Castilleja foliolosa]|uniref:Protein kinase domain-containing protein n=1 Tax=Castilleja foliolosa TaxID=1961234 RepID=A0ABD3CYI1_9LAMI
MRIGHDVAKGLSYLHNEATPKVIFRVLKPTNVLLNEWFHAKISDFGIALTVPAGAQSSTVVTTEPMGTIPYAAPEATLTNSVSLKSDVFSFGVVLLEIIHGSVPIDPKYPRLVAEWVLKPENLDRVPNPEMNGRFIEAELVKAMKLVTRCMKKKPVLRPDMSVVERGMRNLCGEPNVEWPVEINIEVEQAGSSSSSARTHD